MWLPAIAALLIAPIVVGCASDAGAGSSATPTMMAIYSPPVRLGGSGSMIFLPGPHPQRVSVTPPLEKPDPTPIPPTRAWLAGTWLYSASPDDVDRSACASGTTYAYNADGTTAFWEGGGRWRLDGDKLIETVTHANEDIISAKELGVGTSSTVRLRRVGPDEGAVRADGRWERMLRCRAGDVVTK